MLVLFDDSLGRLGLLLHFGISIRDLDGDLVEQVVLLDDFLVHGDRLVLQTLHTGVNRIQLQFLSIHHLQ